VARQARPGNVIDSAAVQLATRHASSGFCPYGVEISTEAAVEANDVFEARGGAALNLPSLLGLEQFPDGFFSAATLRSYLEHELRPERCCGHYGAR